WTLNNASNSLKSGCVSIILCAQIVDSGDAFLRRFIQPVGQVILRGSTLVQAIFFDDLLYHGFILPYLAVEETGLKPNAQAEARATRYRRTPATKRTLWPVASSAVLGRSGAPYSPQIRSLGMVHLEHNDQNRLLC